MNKEVCVVTGGAGFIGSHITDRLIKEGYRTIIIDNFSTGGKENLNREAILCQGNINDLQFLKTTFESISPDFVFHTAALARVPRSIEDPVGTFNTNVTGTLNVFEASRQASVKRVVYSSSSSVYGDQEKIPLTEDMAANPLNPYAMQKYMGELIAQNYSLVYNLDSTCLRYFNVYGPRQASVGAYRLVIAIFMDQKSKGEKLTVFGDGEQTRDFTYISDVVEANILAMKRSHSLGAQAFNIGFGEESSVNQIAELIGGEKSYFPPRDFEEKRKRADNSQARQILGWTPLIDIRQGIHLTNDLPLFSNELMSDETRFS